MNTQIVALGLLLALPAGAAAPEEDNTSFQGTVRKLAPRGDIARHRIETRHYEILYEDGPLSPQSVGAALEAAFAIRKAFFGGIEPPASDLPLRVKIFQDQATYEAAMKKDGIKGSGPGYYSGANGTVYSSTTNLALVIHETTHQFHFKSWGGRNSPAWFSEGIAEMFALFSWDGTTMTCGLKPTGWRTFYPNRVLQMLRGQLIARNPSRLILGKLRFKKKNDNYAFHWAWNRFLLDDDPKAYRRIMDRFRAGDAAPKAWAAAYGTDTVTAEQYERFVKWLMKLPALELKTD